MKNIEKTLLELHSFVLKKMIDVQDNFIDIRKNISTLQNCILNLNEEVKQLKSIVNKSEV